MQSLLAEGIPSIAVCASSRALILRSIEFLHGNGDAVARRVSGQEEGRQKPFDITQRTFLFARDVLKAYPPAARAHPPSAEVWRQLMAAATSTGANMEEAQAASSRIDFRARVKVSLREAREAHFWLRLIRAASLMKTESVQSLEQEAWEIVAILTTIAKRLNPPGEKTPSVRE